MSSDTKDQVEKSESKDTFKDLAKAGKQQCPDPKFMLKGKEAPRDGSDSIVNPCKSDEQEQKKP